VEAKQILRNDIKRRETLSGLCTCQSQAHSCIGEFVTLIHAEQIFRESRPQLRWRHFSENTHIPECVGRLAITVNIKDWIECLRLLLVILSVFCLI